MIALLGLGVDLIVGFNCCCIGACFCGILGCVVWTICFGIELAEWAVCFVFVFWWGFGLIDLLLNVWQVSVGFGLLIYLVVRYWDFDVATAYWLLDCFSTLALLLGCLC